MKCQILRKIAEQKNKISDLCEQVFFYMTDTKLQMQDFSLGVLLIPKELFKVKIIYFWSQKRQVLSI